MAKAVQSVSILAVIFIFFLVISQMPEIEAQDSECLKEYGGDVGFRYCAAEIFPSLCYQSCRNYKGAQGGKCIWGEEGDFTDVKCLCDFCDDSPYLIKI